jgi:acyl-CoA thioester hydrolase
MNPRFKCSDFFCRVYVEDTDFQGVVYHANYLKYLERARSQFLIENKFSQTKAMSKNESFVVSSIKLSYKNPAHLEDELLIQSEIELVSKARMHFFQSVVLAKNDTLICKGEVEVCYLQNNLGKPQAFPLSLLTLLKN